VNESPARATALAALPASVIVRAIADASARWCDADYPPRVRALAAVVRRTGYAEPVVEYALEALFSSIDAERLTAAVELEMGALATLDGAPFGTPARSAGPAGRVTFVSSDTTIGVALVPALFALVAKCEVVVRDRGDDLIATFAETLAEEHAGVGRALRARRWDDRDDDDLLATLAASEVVVAFGRTPALTAIRAATSPEASFLGFGHRTSLAYLEREALATPGAVAELAERAARDALLYDGEGCLSPHAIFVERGGATAPEDVAAELALAFDRTIVEFPTSALGAASVHARARAEAFRRAVATAGAPPPPRLFRSPADAYLLLVEPPAELLPPLEPCVVALYAVDGPADAAAFIARHRVPLEAAGVATPAAVRADVASGLRALGARRIAALGEMQRPAIGGPHGGVARVAPFVRYTWHD